MTKTFITSIALLTLLSSSAFASMPDLDRPLSCKAYRTDWSQPNPKAVAATLEVSNIEADVVTYKLSLLKSGYQMKVDNGNSSSATTAIVTDGNESIDSRYFQNSCGKYISDGAPVHLFVFSNYSGPLYCLSCQ